MSETKFSVIEEHLIHGVLLGMNDKKIANFIGLKPRETSHYIRNLMKKFNVESRKEFERCLTVMENNKITG